MAQTLEISDEASISLEEFIAYTADFPSLQDEQHLREIAPMFRKLLNNHSFVSERINDELRSWRDFQRNNVYTGQVILLACTPTYYLRANIWAPPIDYGDPQLNDDGVFSYGQPHDHNFSFLTGGYLGSGYATTIYEWENMRARHGEQTADIHFLEETTLPRGKMMIYRRFLDIHSQGYAPDFSLSLNVLPHFASEERQYFLDLEKRRVLRTGRDGSGTRDTICDLARHLSDPETVSLLHDIAATHRDGELRRSAIEALTTLDAAAAVSACRLGLASAPEYSDPVFNLRARRVLETLA